MRMPVKNLSINFWQRIDSCFSPHALGQLELLLKLMPYYDLGIFSSATSKTVRKALNAVYFNLKKHNHHVEPSQREPRFLPSGCPSYALHKCNTSILFCAPKSHAMLSLLAVAFHGDSAILFSPILHRDMCQADQEVRSSFVCLLGS